MNPIQSNSRVSLMLHNYTLFSIIFAISMGMIVLIGWIFDIVALKSIISNLATMKFNTAIGFILTGASLWFMQGDEPPREKRQIGESLPGWCWCWVC